MDIYWCFYNYRLLREVGLRVFIIFFFFNKDFILFKGKNVFFDYKNRGISGKFRFENLLILGILFLYVRNF